MELTPKDLRVGNYINFDNTTHVVDEIHKDKLIHHWIDLNGKRSGIVKSNYHLILSLPITSKEIEKLGFNFEENSDLYVDDNGYCIKDDAGNYWLCEHRDEDVVRIVRVDFVHELQNTYFDLTKIELNY